MDILTDKDVHTTFKEEHHVNTPIKETPKNGIRKSEVVYIHVYTV